MLGNVSSGHMLLILPITPKKKGVGVIKIKIVYG